MTVESQSLGVFIRFQERSTEYMDVAVASTKEPASVRSALLKALRCVPLRSIDLTLLRIEYELLAALKSPWKKPNKLQSVLESCRQGKCTESTERLFYKYAGDSGIVILGVASRRDEGLRTKYDGRWLLREIDALSDEQKIDLVTNIHGITEASLKTDVDAILQSFARSPLEGRIPHTHFPRPRNRKTTHRQDTASAECPSSPNPSQLKRNESANIAGDELRRTSSLYPTVATPDVNQHNKRRRLESRAPEHIRSPLQMTSSYVADDITSTSTLLSGLPSLYTRPTAHPPEASNPPGRKRLYDQRVAYTHAPQQLSALEQGLMHDQLSLSGPQSEHDPQLCGWDITQEETTQLIMNAGGIDEYNWSFTEEEITHIINARGTNVAAGSFEPNL